MEGLIFGVPCEQRPFDLWKEFTIFALFYFVFEGNFKVQVPLEGLYSEGQFNGGFFCVTGLGGLYLEGLILGI